MSSEWISFTELLSSIIDNRGRTCPVGDTGIPLIATNCISNNSLYPAYEKVRFVDEETYRTWFRGHPKPGDILFVCKGSPGRTNWVPDPVDFCIAQDMVSVRADPTKVYPKYLFAALRSSSVLSQVDNLHVGTMIPHFKKGDFHKLNIPVPSRADQEFIGDYYFTISERITLLRETNITLEAIAQALFKSWFVDFDPVRAKAEGLEPEGMDAATAALFPDSFEESDLGLVPRGWRMATLADCCERVESGGTPKRTVPEYWGGNIPWLTSGEVRNPIVFDTKEKISDLGVINSSAKLWPKGTTVVAMYGATAGEVCLLAEPSTANQACCALIPKSHSRAFIFMYVRREREALASKSSGSAQQNLNKGLVSNHPVLLAHTETLIAYEELVGSMLDGWIENERQSQTLTQLRDTLLPRLISGQLRLAEAEANVESALLEAI